MPDALNISHPSLNFPQAEHGIDKDFLGPFLFFARVRRYRPCGPVLSGLRLRCELLCQ